MAGDHLAFAESVKLHWHGSAKGLLVKFKPKYLFNIQVAHSPNPVKPGQYCDSLVKRRRIP